MKRSLETSTESWGGEHTFESSAVECVIVEGFLERSAGYREEGTYLSLDKLTRMMLRPRLSVDSGAWPIDVFLE